LQNENDNFLSATGDANQVFQPALESRNPGLARRIAAKGEDGNEAMFSGQERDLVCLTVSGSSMARSASTFLLGRDRQLGGR